MSYAYPLDVSLTGIAIKATAFAGISALPFLFGILHVSDNGLARDTVFRAMFSSKT